MKYITHFFRIIVGLVFIVSGFVKTVDPIGFSYKLEEYFGPEVFNIPFLQKLALPLAIFFVILEIMLGIFLLLGVWKKLTVYLLLVLIIFFSLLTFYSAYFHAVNDCGCFGEALTLVPWTSFWKDIVLLIMILFLIFGLKHIKPLFPSKISWFVLGGSFVICCWIAYQGIAHLPIIDFRAYAVGKDLNKGMKDGRPQEKSIAYIMKNLKTNEEKKYTAEEYTNSDIWKDSLNWIIKDTHEEVIDEGVPNSVTNFTIDCGNGDRTEEVLHDDKVAVFTVPYAKNLSVIEKAGLRKITSELAQKNIKFVILANDPGVLSPVSSCATDQTTLKTINRSNPGLMVLKKGIVVKKYHANDFPAVKEIEKL